LGLVGIIYNFRKNFEIPEEWIQNMTAACFAPAESAFLGEYLKGHGLATVAGCLFGLLFSARFFGGMSSYTRPRECFPINLAFRVILLVAVTIPLD
jgi:hypothetical protein